MLLRAFLSILLLIGSLAPSIAATQKDQLISHLYLMMDTADDLSEQYRQPHVRAQYEENFTKGDHTDYEELVAHCEKSGSKVKEALEIYVDCLSPEDASLNEFLGRLLLHRLCSLAERTRNLELYFDQRNKNAFICPSTHELYRELADQRYTNKLLQQNELRLSQMFFHLIQMTFHLVDPEEITGDTSKWLSLSPQLWPYLSFSQKVPPTTDECGGYAPLKKLYDLLPDHLKKKGNMSHVIATYVWPAYTDPLRLKEIYTPEEEAEYLAFRKTCDGEIYKAYCVPSPMAFLKDASLSVRSPSLPLDPRSTPAYAMQRKGDIAAAYFVIPDNIEADWLSAWPPLSRPSFLQEMIDRRQQGVREPLALSPSQDMPSKAVGKKKGPAKRTAPKKKTQTKGPYPPSMAEEEAGPREATLPVEKRDEAEEEIARGEIAIKNEEEIRAPELERTTFASEFAPEDEVSEGHDAPASAPFETGASAKSEAMARPCFEFVYPRGISSNGNLLARAYPPQQHEGALQAFIDHLFDPIRNVNITFGDVEKNFRRLGASIEGYKNGGSHRVFVAPNGQKLWGTYDHGGYGHRTIKYPQAAFYFLGCRPSSSRLTEGRNL